MTTPSLADVGDILRKIYGNKLLGATVVVKLVVDEVPGTILKVLPVTFIERRGLE